MRRLRVYLMTTVLVAVIALGATVAADNKPVLGLDLQGGISVVLAPVGDYKAASLDVAVDIIRNRVDALGVSEPEISRQGENIVVDLPGVKDRNEARRLVGRTAELRFRPVLLNLAPESSTSTTTTSSTTSPSATTTTTPSPTTTTTVPTAGTSSDEEITRAIGACNVQLLAALPEVPTTRREDDERDLCVVLPIRTTGGRQPGRLLLGPVVPNPALGLPEGLTGGEVDDARAEFNAGRGWSVTVKLKQSGQDKFNALAAASFGRPSPRDQVAIVLDGEVQSNPAFQTSSFPDEVQITGDFTQTEARDLARIIDYGALPVRLDELTSQDISPTLGKDQLDAGIVAGAIGLGLVAAYMIVYYRILGLVVILGLLLTAMLTYSLIAFLSETAGLTLTLAGVTGLIVSTGVTVDSYVVYFEKLKDEVRSGRTVRSSVEPGFARSWRTILAADLVSLIGAATLYLLAIGAVRGFAFFLGVATFLDLLVSYFFMHPLVTLLARRPALVRMRGIGIAAGLDTKGATS